jgi:pyruvate/2-oxoglutarate dehydrogenase complex dihydrolipoamide dehydrogenase (E3) component
MQNKKFDAIIIGFGKGGKTLAGKLASEGKSVALAEMDKNMYGGTCINVGCIPSKSLYTSAAAVSGKGTAVEQDATFKAAIEEKRRVTGFLRGKNYGKLAQNPHVTIYDGHARFTGSHQVEVTTEKETLSLEAPWIFINTGSTSFIPPIPGATETKGVYTSNGMMELDALPRHLVILGGGYIGLEFASMFANFGSKVDVLVDGTIFLPREDRDVAEAIKQRLEKQGVVFHMGAQTKSISEGPTLLVAMDGKEEEIKADVVLLATGRVPNTKGLGLENAGIETTPRGAVKVDELLRTTAPGVWAMGDVTGGLQHTYVSLDDFRIVSAQLHGKQEHTTLTRPNIPYSVFLSTPYARIGMNEDEAKKAGLEVKVSKIPTASIPKAQVLRATDGFLKAVIDAKSGKILGVMLLCPESYEMINIVKTAMDLGADYTVLRDQIYTHPTMSEALNDLFSI